MYVLPQTPVPTHGKPYKHLDAACVSQRVALTSPGSPQYLLALSNYIDSLFQSLVNLHGTTDLEQLAGHAADVILGELPQWLNIQVTKLARFKFKDAETPQWTLAAEIAVALAALALAYFQVGTDLTNDLIDACDSSDARWRQVGEHYKTGGSVAAFAATFTAPVSGPGLPPPTLWALIGKLAAVCTQLALLCKAAAENRAQFSQSESFTSRNNGVLCRVAVWVLEEVKSCRQLARALAEPPKGKGDCFAEVEGKAWARYFDLVQRYVAAYAALFLSIDQYQQNRMGHAIGLVNYGLVALQCKTIERQKGLRRLVGKIGARRNENFVLNLQSVSELDIDRLVFLGLAMVHDLLFLFDLLVLLHLKFSKENDNLHFDTVVDWKDMGSDSKWPLAACVPVSAGRPYCPEPLQSS